MTDLIVSAEEARELLGDDSKNLSDDEIERTIILLDEIAKDALKQARCKIIGDEKSKMGESKPKTLRGD